MVDPNPGRGMPLQLQRYWLAGKGAAKIRWGIPGDFLRCVRNLRKYFPKDPKGLCNILHQKALGVPPGQEHKHSLAASLHDWDDLEALVAAQALMDKQPELGRWLWAGPLAPIGKPTGEPRRSRTFAPGALSHRVLPLPLDWREKTGQGHDGSRTVGRILGITYGPDHAGEDYAWGWGDYLNEAVFPEVTMARTLAADGVAGVSLDPGGPVSVMVDPKTGAETMTQYVIGGATLVSIPAFGGMRMTVFAEGADWPDDDEDMADPNGHDCGCQDASAGSAPAGTPMGVSTGAFTVNSSGWRGLPLAARDAVFDNDLAVQRIAAWANVGAQGTDVSKLRRAFMWYNPQLPPTDPTSYRLPVGDIINGQLTLIYHAIYAAAALLNGAHGGLPGVPDQDRNELRDTITAIYPEMATAFNDSTIRAPWDRSAQPGVQLAMDVDTFATGDEGFPIAPPKKWFEDPKLTGKTKLTVGEDGRVYGHLAAWGECHRDVTMRECVLAPKSQQNYAPFHLGGVLTAEGELVEVGKIVQDTRHADIRLGYTAAALHYDNTGDEIAVVRAGEDQFGIWVAGSVVPDATKKRVAKLRRSPLSGDWRREKGSLELTAALAVNTPAFPVYAMEDEEQLALVAAGSVWTDEEPVEDFAAELHEAVQALAAPPTGIVDQYSAEYRQMRLQEIFEDEEIYAARLRAERLQRLFAAEGGNAPAPTQTVAPMPAAPAASGTPAPQMAVQGGEPDPNEMLAQQQNARFAVIDDSGNASADTSTPASTPTPVTTPAPKQ